MNIKNMLRDGIKELVPYEVVPFEGKVKLDAMENPYDLHPLIKDEFLRELKGLAVNRYPDPMASELRIALSLYLGVDREMIILGNGSDELILDLLLTFGRGKIVYPEPTFAMYEILAKIAGAEPVGVPLREDFELDAESILEVGQKGIIFITYPNNPTGNLFNQEAIIRIIEEGSCLVVVDEAYYEFSGKTFLPLVKKYPNLVILRTFSKAFGLAGARVGYLVANKEVTGEILKVKLPYNLNAISQLLATITLRHGNLLRERIDEITSERERVYKELQEIPGITPYPSKTNFILFKVENLRNRDLFDLLIKEGILIRNLGESGILKNSLRLTIGKPGENDIFLEVFKKILQEGDIVRLMICSDTSSKPLN